MCATHNTNIIRPYKSAFLDSWYIYPAEGGKRLLTRFPTCDIIPLVTSRRGGTVYALVSKTSPREGLRVRIPPPAFPVYSRLPSSPGRSTGRSGFYRGLPESQVVSRVCCQFCCQGWGWKK